jgi:hypothetical protein
MMVPPRPPIQILDGLDLLAVPAAHLHAEIAADQRHHAGLGVEVVQQLAAAALEVPGALLPPVHAEGQAAVEGVGGVLADIEGGIAVAAFHRAVLHRVEYLQRRHDLAGGVHRDLELAVGHLADALGPCFRCTVDGVERLGPARHHAPADRRLRLHDRRRGNRARGNAN